MQLVVEFTGLSKLTEMERTCYKNKDVSKFIDYDNQDILRATYKISMQR